MCVCVYIECGLQLSSNGEVCLEEERKLFLSHHLTSLLVRVPLDPSQLHEVEGTRQNTCERRGVRRRGGRRGGGEGEGEKERGRRRGGEEERGEEGRGRRRGGEEATAKLEKDCNPHLLYIEGGC